MAEVENLVKVTLEEIEKVLTTRTVVGEPMTIEGATIIPLISIGFGFGAGGGSGKGKGEDKGKGEGEGTGGGSGGGAGIKPVAIIVVDKQGVRIETIKGGLASAIEKFSETIPPMLEKCMEKCMGKWGERKEAEKKKG